MFLLKVWNFHLSWNILLLFALLKSRARTLLTFFCITLTILNCHVVIPVAKALEQHLSWLAHWALVTRNYLQWTPELRRLACHSSVVLVELPTNPKLAWDLMFCWHLRIVKQTESCYTSHSVAWIAPERLFIYLNLKQRDGLLLTEGW